MNRACLLRRPARLGMAVFVMAGLLAARFLPGPASAEPLVADLTSHLVGITTGFTGASVVLFGATDGPGEIIVVIRGPDRDIMVRRKSKIAGIWANTRSMTFAAVPSFYAVAASRPVDEILPAATAALHRIGAANLNLQTKSSADPELVRAFAQALVRAQQRNALFADSVGKVSFLGDRLFRTPIAFPANVPTGTYLVEIFLIRDKDIVSGQTTPLIVSKVGLGATVFDFASRRAALYGAIAVLTAMVAGWLAYLPFRGV